MQRSHLLGLTMILAIAATIAVLIWQGGGVVPPPAPPGSAEPGPEVVESGIAPLDGSTAAADAGARRRAVSTPRISASTETDPEIRAALTGFRGRVVDHQGQPVGGCGVEIYRFAIDSVLPEGIDLFADQATLEPQYEAGETTTSDDGTFLIGGIWPRALYLLHAGIGTDAPSHRLLPHAPGPGEIHELGDIVLNHAAVVTGRVIDEDGEPVPEAAVRAVDLPGQLLGFVPVERFDPAGCLLIREPDSPVHVLEMPPWVQRAFDQLPIATTSTDATGSFRLGGLVAGSNLVVVTKPGFLASVEPSVRLEAGQEKSIGTIRLERGEELYGMVVDGKGEPIAGAQVVAGSTLPMLPVDFGSYVGPSAEDGSFSAEGFAAGRVTVAARRTDEDPWVMAEPQPILSDVVVTLPAVASLTVHVQGADGAPVADPKLRLLAAGDEEAAVVMSLFGVLRSIDIESRTTGLEDGGIRIDGLQLGKFVLLATAEGARLATAEVDIQATENAVVIELEAGIEHRVRVVGPRDRPVRGAKVFVQERGRSVREMPWCAGRTDAEGRLRVDGAGTEVLRVSASHPRWGTVHGESRTEGGELVLRLQDPGWIEGTLTHFGRAPEPGKFTVSAEWRPEQRGPLEDVPVLATPGLDGGFVMRALQPGRYSLEVISSLEALTSPGGVFSVVQSMMMMGSDMPRETVQVVSGQGVEVHLNVGGEEYSGPTGNVFGSVMIDGQLAEGYVVAARTAKGRVMREIDAAGRFDLGAVPVGKVWITIVEGGNAMVFDRHDLWRESVDVEEAEQEEVVIDLRTTSLSGVVLRPGGSPAVGMRVRIEGRPLDGKDGWGPRARITTDANGVFRVEKLAEGVFTIRAQGRRGDPVRGELADVRATSVAPGTGLRLQLGAAAVVAGRIDERAFPSRPQWGWVEFRRVDPEHPGDRKRARHAAGEGFDSGLSFSTQELRPGVYFVSVHVNLDGNWVAHEVPDPITVPEQGLSGLVLMPVRRGQ